MWNRETLCWQSQSLAPQVWGKDAAAVSAQQEPGVFLSIHPLDSNHTLHAKVLDGVAVMLSCPAAPMQALPVDSAPPTISTYTGQALRRWICRAKKEEEEEKV